MNDDEKFNGHQMKVLDEVFNTVPLMMGVCDLYDLDDSNYSSDEISSYDFKFVISNQCTWNGLKEVLTKKGISTVDGYTNGELGLPLYFSELWVRNMLKSLRRNKPIKFVYPRYADNGEFPKVEDFYSNKIVWKKTRINRMPSPPTSDITSSGMKVPRFYFITEEVTKEEFAKEKLITDFKDRLESLETKMDQKVDERTETTVKFVLESIPQMVWVTDDKGKIEFLNSKWKDYLGVNHEGHILNWNEISKNQSTYNISNNVNGNSGSGSGMNNSNNSIKSTNHLWMESLKNKKRFEAEIQLQSIAGEYRWFLVRADPYIDENSSAYNIENNYKWIGTCTDLNDQKTAQDRIELAEKAKDNFLRTMSHEMRTPLAGILGMNSWLIGSQCLNSDQLDCFTTINMCAEALLVLINNILDLSKLEENKIVLEETEFSPTKIVEDSVDILSNQAEQKKIDIIYQLNYQNVPNVIGDFYRIRQVLTNLISNSVKFTPNHGQVIVGYEIFNEKSCNSNIKGCTSTPTPTPPPPTSSMVTSTPSSTTTTTTTTGSTTYHHLENNQKRKRYMEDFDQDNPITITETSIQDHQNNNNDITLLKDESNNVTILTGQPNTTTTTTTKAIDQEQQQQQPLPPPPPPPSLQGPQHNNFHHNHYHHHHHGRSGSEGSIHSSDTVHGRYGKLKFWVIDNGIGISEEYKDKLFQSFSQYDASASRKYGGSGLGLAISKRLTQLLGGDIWFESTKGKGSSFYFIVEVFFPSPPPLSSSRNSISLPLLSPPLLSPSVPTPSPSTSPSTTSTTSTTTTTTNNNNNGNSKISIPVSSLSNLSPTETTVTTTTTTTLPTLPTLPILPPLPTENPSNGNTNTINNNFISKIFLLFTNEDLKQSLFNWVNEWTRDEDIQISFTLGSISNYITDIIKHDMIIDFLIIIEERYFNQHKQEVSIVLNYLEQYKQSPKYNIKIIQTGFTSNVQIQQNIPLLKKPIKYSQLKEVIYSNLLVLQSKSIQSNLASTLKPIHNSNLLSSSGNSLNMFLSSPLSSPGTNPKKPRRSLDISPSIFNNNNYYNFETNSEGHINTTSNSQQTSPNNITSQQQQRRSSIDTDLPLDMTGVKYPLKIMVAEDSLVNQKVANKFLTRLGYKQDDLIFVVNGQQAIDYLEKNEMVDCILMDMSMPELDGCSATNIIRSRYPTLGPHIIGLTANAFNEDKDKCLLSGMCQYLAKPIKIETLALELKKAYLTRKNLKVCLCKVL